MSGLPPIDRLYYENPSIRLGGWIAWCLHQERGQPRLNLVPGESAYTTITTSHFGSLTELADHLRLEHKVGYYYRGQTRRRRITYEAHVSRLAAAFPQLSPLSITTENLLPSIFRSVVGDNVAGWDTYQYPSILDSVTPAIRLIAASAHDALRHLLRRFFEQLSHILPVLMLSRLGVDLTREGAGVTGLNSLAGTLGELISLSQHYELTSAMIDITSSPDVAVWFASHSWSGQVTRDGDGLGVIYRFQTGRVINDAISKELLRETPARLAISVAGLLGVTDIAASEYGLRPVAQSGGSIMGLENSVTLYLLDVYEAMEVFTYPLNSTLGSETAITKQDLCPSQDPVAAVFSQNLADLRQPLQASELHRLAIEAGLKNDDAKLLARGRVTGFL